EPHARRGLEDQLEILETKDFNRLGGGMAGTGKRRGAAGAGPAGVADSGKAPDTVGAAEAVPADLGRLTHETHGLGERMLFDRSGKEIAAGPRGGAGAHNSGAEGATPSPATSASPETLAESWTDGGAELVEEKIPEITPQDARSPLDM